MMSFDGNLTVNGVHITDLNVQELKFALSANGLSKKGKKVQLLKRLKGHLLTVHQTDIHTKECTKNASSSTPSPGPPTPKQVKTTTSSSPFQYPIILEDLKTGCATLRGVGPLNTKIWTNTIGPILCQKPLPSGKWLIGCSTADQQSKLKNTTNLAGIHVTCIIPDIVTYGVIKSVPLDVSEDDILMELKNVKSISRLKNKDGSLSRAIKLTFLEGKLPSEITLGFQMFKVFPFVNYVLRCLNCNRFGHAQSSCKNKKSCPKCGNHDHEVQTCQNSLKCINCGGKHSAAYHGCPEFKVRIFANKLKSSRFMPYAEALLLARKQNENSNASQHSNESLLSESTSRNVTMCSEKSFADVVGAGKEQNKSEHTKDVIKPAQNSSTSANQNVSKTDAGNKKSALNSPLQDLNSNSGRERDAVKEPDTLSDNQNMITILFEKNMEKITVYILNTLKGIHEIIMNELSTLKQTVPI